MTTKTVLVTGASLGIGLATSKKLLSENCKVIALARHFDPDLAKLDAYIPYTLDLCDETATESIIKTILKEHQPNALICNAGAGKFGMLEQYSPEQIKTELQLNLYSHILLTRLLIASMKKLSRSNIVFVGSESALQGGRYGSIYSAAKFGLRGFAQSLRHECSGNNCHVGIVNPGMVRTDFFDNLDFEPGPQTDNALEACDVANAIWSMLASPDHAVIDEINLNPLKKVARKKPAK